MLRLGNNEWIGARATLFFLVALVVATAGAAGAADKYPARAIDVYLGSNPGSVDVIMRPFMDKFQEVLKQPLKYEFKPGGGGAIAATYVANAKPDGYTLLGASPVTVVLNPLTVEGIPYTLEDFAPILRVTTQPSVIVVRSESHWKTLKDLIEDAKKSPGKLNFSAGQLIGTDSLPMLMLEKAAGFKATLVPSGGAARSATAILGGHVDFAILQLQAAGPHIKSGTLRGLAQIGQKRHPDLPNVPTLQDLGFQIPFEGWAGLLGPKNLGKDVLGILADAADKTIKTYGKTIEQDILKMDAQFDYLNAQEFGKMLRQQRDTSKVILDDLKKSGQK